jgi:acyl-CoA thioesterase
MDTPEAFYNRDGDRLIATASTRGPWQIDHQHGGPPAAVLAGAFAAELGPDWHPARITVEFLRPISVNHPLRVSVARTRDGKQVVSLTGELYSDDRPVARAHALWVRRRELPELAPPACERDPQRATAFTFDFFRWPLGYHTAVETRLESGEIGRGPATVWLRPRHPLIAGEPSSPLQRVMIAADAINGIGHVLDLRRYSFANADLTVYLHRLPTCEWVRLAATPHPQVTGVGLVDAELCDMHGPIGRALEAQVIAPRPPLEK